MSGVKIRAKSLERVRMRIVDLWRPCHLSLWVPLFCYGLFLVWINPFFEYVVGDDWIYARSSYDLALHHLLKIHDPSVASLLWQAIWGYLFTLPFGFSFSALHLSTITIFVISVVFWYRTLRLCATRELYVFAGTMMLVSIPQVPVLSISFNTDIHAFAYLLISLYFYLKYLKDRSMGALAGGAIASSLGILVRQTIILLPVSTCLTLWITRQLQTNSEISGAFWKTSTESKKEGPTGNRRLLRLFWHVLPFGVLVGFYAWIKWVHGVPFVWRYQNLELFNLNRVFTELVADPVYTAHYAVIFLLPLILALLLSSDFYRKVKALLRTPAGVGMGGTVFAGVVGLTLLLVVWRGEWMPYLQGDSYLLAWLIPINWKWVTVLTTAGAMVVTFSLLPSLAQLLLQFQSRVLASRPGKYLVKRVVRRSLEGGLILAGLVVASGAARPLIIPYGNWLVQRLYNDIGAIGGAHGFPLDFWTNQVGQLYAQIRWIGSGVLVILAPLISFLAGNRKIEAVLNEIAETKFDRGPAGLSPSGSWTGDANRVLSHHQKRNLYLAVYMVLTVVFMIITGLRFDRYLIVFYPAIALLFFSQMIRVEVNRSLLAVLLFAFMIFSSLNARAILAPQEASWRAYNDLVRQGVAGETIDAGLYVSNWFNYKPENYRRISLKERWWIEDIQYAIRERPLPGYRVLSMYPYNDPFAGERYLYVLKRIEPAASSVNNN